MRWQPLQAKTAIQTQTHEEMQFREEAQRRQPVPEGRENKVPSRSSAKANYISFQWRPYPWHLVGWAKVNHP